MNATEIAEIVHDVKQLLKRSRATRARAAKTIARVERELARERARRSEAYFARVA